MKTLFNLVITGIFMLGTPLAAVAMESHGDHGQTKTMDHGAMSAMKHGQDGNMEGMKHDGMKMDDGTIMLGDQTEAGVKAMPHLKDVRATMAKMGMKETHHFAIMFTDTATGQSITEGTVAVKIRNPAGHEGEAIKLVGMDGHFGADLVLPDKGEYHFKVGTKLADGKTRQYHLHHDVE